jgi:AcrR family transcriptional regulator
VVQDNPGARVRILDAAERLFAERGFDATPTASIAKLAAVPKGLLFYYFPTKAELLRTLVAERLDFGPIDANALIEPGDPARALLNLARRLSELEADSAVLRVIIWREQRTHPEVGDKLHEHRGQVQAVVERVLRGSLLRPIAARTLRAAAVAWVAVLTIRPLADHKDPNADDAAPDLPALAELICTGLISSALA